MRTVIKIRVIWDENTNDGHFARCVKDDGQEQDIPLDDVDLDDDDDVRGYVAEWLHSGEVAPMCPVVHE